MGRTVYELRQMSCLPLDLMEPTRKGIAATRILISANKDDLIKGSAAAG